MEWSHDLEQEIASRVKTGGYDTREDLLRDALRALDEERALGQQLLEALESGDRIEVTPEYWEEQKRRIRERRLPPDTQSRVGFATFTPLCGGF